MNKSIITLVFASLAFQASADSAAGHSAPIEQFYRPFDVATIPMHKMQSWPYYRHVSMHMDRFVAFGINDIAAAATPAPLKLSANPVPLTMKFGDDKRLLDSLVATQTKGFVVMQQNRVLAEFYDNGYNRGMQNNLQSASKTVAGVIIGQLVDKGLIDLEKSAADYLPKLRGTTIGAATVRNIANMASGIEALGDYHTEGSNGYQWELEIGLQSKGTPIGHLNAIKSAKASGAAQGSKWEYSDQNTDTLGLIAERVTGKSFAELLQALANDIGFHDRSGIAKTSDGTTSPAYGINLSAIDYALFHQYIAEGKAGQAFYQLARDSGHDLFHSTPLADLMSQKRHTLTYGMQTYYIADEDILISLGSFGQMGFSDLKSGISVVNQQDWSLNIDVDKLPEVIERSVAVIKALR